MGNGGEGKDAGRPAATEARVLAAAQACFERSGVARTSVDEIAAESGVSRQTVYRYFSNKQAMLEAIALKEMSAIGREIKARVGAIERFPDRLTEALLASATLGRGNGYVQLIINDPASMRRCFGRDGDLYRWEREAWRPFIAGGRRQGEIADDLDDDAVVRWLAMSQLTLLLLTERLPEWGVGTREFIRRFFVEPVLARTVDGGALVASELGRVRASLDGQAATLAALVAGLAPPSPTKT